MFLANDILTFIGIPGDKISIDISRGYITRTFEVTL